MGEKKLWELKAYITNSEDWLDAGWFNFHLILILL
jgi:hypothetical protein